MIRSQNIKKNDGIIECDILPEDSKIPGKLRFDCSMKKIIKCILPNGYEYCESHIAHASAYLANIAENDEFIPEAKTIMWY